MLLHNAFTCTLSPSSLVPSSDVCRRNALSQIKLFWPLDEKFEPSHGVFCPTNYLDDVICGWMYLSGASTRHFVRY